VDTEDVEVDVHVDVPTPPESGEASESSDRSCRPKI
jgi:hypothetical protein